MSSRRYLGPLDAANDERFQEHFVSQKELRALSSPHSDIVYGAKGAGKTTLRRALTEIKRDLFFNTGTIDLNTLSFERVHVELEKLKHVTGEDTIALARSTWRAVIAMYFLELVRAMLPAGQLATDIDELLRREAFTERSAPTRMLNQVEQFLMRLGLIGLDNSELVDTYVPTEQIRMVVDQFPPSADFARVLRAACDTVAASGRTVAVSVDGFDSIVDHLPKSRKAIFAGLIDAVFRLSEDPLLASALSVKAFLPKELTHEARAINWDADKFLYHTHYLHWNEASLKEFIAKRLTPHLRSKRSDLDGIWHEFMPATIRNSVHGIDEPSFQYVLRHTQFRPRQLLFHVQSILDTWDETYNAFKVDPKFIPAVVAASNRKLADAAVKQLEYARPGFVMFMRSFGGGSSIFTFSECYSKIGKMFGVATDAETRAIFDELFDFGVMGVARQQSVSRGVSTIRVRYVYAGEGVTNVYPADTDIVAICPMFHDYCGCIPSEFGAVIPSRV